MKRFLFSLLILIILIIGTIITINNKEKEDIKKKIVVAEVTHSVFYAPWYVALANNYFDDLEIDVILTSGANNVITSVISGDADIGLCGAEATIYINDEYKDKVKSFASLTKRDGQYLILKKNIKFNNINDLNGLTILSGRAGGMPLLSFKDVIDKNNLKVNIDSSVDFANLSAAFISGTYDGVNLFEPNANILVSKGYGYKAIMLGTYSSIVPYTTFNAKTSYINNNKDVINKFYNGINKGLKYVETHTSKDIAYTIKDYFKDINIKDLIKMVDDYKNNDSWFNNASLKEEYFINLENILKDNNLINKYYKYNDLVYEIN